MSGEKRMPVIANEAVITYSPIPLDCLERSTWAVRVEYAGHGRWAVRNASLCLSRAGEWTLEPIPSSRSDEWLAEHRFTRQEAEQVAWDVCGSVTWNGQTADEIARRWPS